MRFREIFIISSVGTILLTGGMALWWQQALWMLMVLLPLILIGGIDLLQKRHTIRRNFPVIGHFRYLLEKFRPEIMQYFVETDTEGTPINRMFRSLIYQRAKNVNETTPFGTKMNVYQNGYECMAHTMFPLDYEQLDKDPKHTIGGPDCRQAYRASLLNISAMSYGALSKNAILALNRGARLGGFAHNTGEGGISQYHLAEGGHLIWQIGTGYFGCRTPEGDFCPDTFRQNAVLSQVKMIEIKLSQGAKPGHGGMLPAVKNTPEIAAIRHTEPFTDVFSPPFHKAFHSPEGLLEFITRLRHLSAGKPIGIKLCIGEIQEFESLVKVMKSYQVLPDFIVIDGGEGGTGAAPVEFSNSLGLPLRDALAFAHDTLVRHGLREKVSLIASGKILTAFHIARAIGLGADLVYSARAMMMAMGCIQALRCNNNSCPVGIATQDKSLMNGLVVAEKGQRVANFHRNTLESFVELLAAAGLSRPEQLSRRHILHRIGPNQLLSYAELYPESLPEDEMNVYQK